jgi:hypothetical protein
MRPARPAASPVRLLFDGLKLIRIQFAFHEQRF